MPTNAVVLEIDGKCAARSLEEAIGKLAGDGGEMVLDISSVRRIDSEALKALEKLVGAADEKHIKLALHGVGVDVYRVLKLMKLAPRFAYTA